ncbi:MAG: BON domain-containing protein [Candidatus Acidiferrales bacterium]
MRRAWQAYIALGALLAPLLAGQAALATAGSPLPEVEKSRPAAKQKLTGLEERIRRELVTLPFYSVFDNLEFRVDNYRVTLAGQVTRPTLRSRAEKVVKRIEGVEAVVNNIEVLPVSFNDDRIRRATYHTLYNINSPLHRYGVAPVPSIHIIVKRGHITLVGLVDNKTDSNIAYIRARGVPGSFSVTNRLRVAN